MRHFFLLNHYNSKSTRGVVSPRPPLLRGPCSTNLHVGLHTQGRQVVVRDNKYYETITVICVLQDVCEGLKAYNQQKSYMKGLRTENYNPGGHC